MKGVIAICGPGLKGPVKRKGGPTELLHGSKGPPDLEGDTTMTPDLKMLIDKMDKAIKALECEAARMRSVMDRIKWRIEYEAKKKG